jgi:hypothetical protein
MKIVKSPPPDAKQAKTIYDLVIINPLYPNNYMINFKEIYLKNALSEDYSMYEYHDEMTSKTLKPFIRNKQLFYR